MFDSSFRAFVIVAAALVISPGASMAVVTGMALQRGRFAALLTVVGINRCAFLNLKNKLMLGLFMLVLSTVIVGYGNYLGARLGGH